MNKVDLINAISEKSGLSKVDSKAALEGFVSAVSDGLKKDGDKISIVGFGTYSVARREERQGRNPKTGSPITIPARNAVKFKAGKELVNNAN